MTEEKTEEKMEAPQVEEAPEVKPETPDIPDLIATLERAGVQNTADLTNKLRASEESGRLANLLGDVRRENAELKEMLKNMNRQPQQREDWDQQPVDIEAAIGRALDKKLTEREQRQMQMQQAAWAAYNRIHGDEDFHLVANEWAKKERDPQFALKLQAGQVDPIDEYQKMVRRYYKDVALRAAATIKTLTGGGKPPQVNVESSARMPSGKTPAQSEQLKKVQAMKDRVDKGGALTEEDELAALTAILSGK